jgi:hypothetical protein
MGRRNIDKVQAVGVCGMNSSGVFAYLQLAGFVGEDQQKDNTSGSHPALLSTRTDAESQVAVAQYADEVVIGGHGMQIRRMIVSQEAGTELCLSPDSRPHR